MIPLLLERLANLTTGLAKIGHEPTVITWPDYRRRR